MFTKTVIQKIVAVIFLMTLIVIPRMPADAQVTEDATNEKEPQPNHPFGILGTMQFSCTTPQDIVDCRSIAHPRMVTNDLQHSRRIPGRYMVITTLVLVKIENPELDSDDDISAYLMLLYQAGQYGFVQVAVNELPEEAYVYAVANTDGTLLLDADARLPYIPLVDQTRLYVERGEPVITFTDKD